MPKFIMIVGPQAVGKMTVAQELSKLSGYKLLYNHMTIELVRLIFDYDNDIYGKVNSKIRKIIFNEFAKSCEKGIIFTACLDFGKGLKKQLKEFYKWIENYDDVYVVELGASLDERIKRNKTENRLNYKASKRNIEWSENDLLASLTLHKYNSTGNQGEMLFKNFIKIDNTDLDAKTVATMIAQKFL